MIGELFENLNQNTHYPILRSDLRPAKDNTDLTMMKMHAQLLEVREIYANFVISIMIVLGKRTRFT